MGNNRFGAYVQRLAEVVQRAVVTTRAGERLPLELAVSSIGSAMRAAHERGDKLIFCGNGGSAAISSHMATDFSKNGGMRALSLNDGAVLTCLANDYGYEHVFEKQIEWHARPGDILVAISSSGASSNILNAVAAARRCGCVVYTLSGFRHDNPLRTSGDLNIHLSDPDYGFVEVGHLTILHGILDLQMGCGAADLRRVAGN